MQVAAWSCPSSPLENFPGGSMTAPSYIGRPSIAQAGCWQHRHPGPVHADRQSGQRRFALQVLRERLLEGAHTHASAHLQDAALRHHQTGRGDKFKPKVLQATKFPIASWDDILKMPAVAANVRPSRLWRRLITFKEGIPNSLDISFSTIRWTRIKDTACHGISHQPAAARHAAACRQR